MHSFHLAPEHFDLVTVAGQDAVRFLQGQLTCDVQNLADGSATWGACCNNKGRVHATFLLARQGDTLMLVLARGTGTLLAAALRKFLPFYKCTLTLNPEGWICLGLAGAAAGQLLAGHFGVLPEMLAGKMAGTDWLLTLDHTTQQFLVCDMAGKSDRLATLQAQLATGTEGEWQALSMQAGHFPFSAADTEKFTPQELHLDRHGYVSFSKGCYTGQEIVARMHYRGKPKKQLYRLETTLYDPAWTETGFPVADAQGTVLAHTIKQAQAGQGGSLYGLAQLPVEFAESSPALQTSEGHPLVLRPL